MKEVRFERIMEILKRRGYATVDEIAKELGISKITARRDLSFLESQGLVERRRGGALLKNFHREIPFFMKLERRKNQKIRVAKEAVKLLNSGDVIFASGGTTVYYTVQEISRSDVSDITIMTNSITTAWAVINSQKPISLIHTGGSVREGSFECVGAQVMSFVERTNADVFLIGVNGIDLEKGISFDNYEESLIAQKMIENSSKVIVVSDSSKLGKVSPYKVSDLDGVDFLVVDDSEKSRKIKKVVENMGIKVILA